MSVRQSKLEIKINCFLKNSEVFLNVEDEDDGMGEHTGSIIQDKA